MEIDFSNFNFHYGFINLNCLAITWVPAKNAKCWPESQGVNLKIELGNLHENQVS